MDTKTSKTAIVCYSRSGHSERLAMKLAERLNGTLIRIAAPEYPSGFLGSMRAGFHSLKQHCILAPQSFASVAAFDLVVICGPVWTSYPATPIRAFLRSDAGFPARIALFLTSGSSAPANKAWAAASQDLGRPFVAKAVLGNSLEGTEQETRIIDQFLQELGPDRSSSSPG